MCNDVICKIYDLLEKNYSHLIIPLDINLQEYHLSERERMKCYTRKCYSSEVTGRFCESRKHAAKFHGKIFQVRSNKPVVCILLI